MLYVYFNTLLRNNYNDPREYIYVFDRRLMHARILFSDHSKLHHNARLQSQLKYSMDAIFSELTSPQKQPFSLLSSTGTLYFQMNLVLYL